MDVYDGQSLNQRFGIDGHIAFAQRGGLLVAEMRGAGAVATVALQGGQVLEFQPSGEEPVLFLSSRSHFEIGKAPRGGIPICWPWFGPHPSDPSLPQHGFARIMPWSVVETRVLEGGRAMLRLALHDDETTRQAWPYAFSLEYTVTVGPELEVELLHRNTDQATVTITNTLHTYLSVGAVERCVIHGLDGCDYLDKVDAFARKTQHGPVTISGETDRIYLGTTTPCVVEDPVIGRSISVWKEGSRSTVVWNPWIEKAQAMEDFDPLGYLRMVCVESANAADDAMTVAPGAEHRLRVRLSLQHG